MHRKPARPAFCPHHSFHIDSDTVAVDLDSVSHHTLFDALGKEHSKGAIRVHDIVDIAQPDRHLISVALGDRTKRRRRVEVLESAHANAQPNADAVGFEIDDAARCVRPFVILETTLTP